MAEVNTAQLKPTPASQVLLFLGAFCAGALALAAVPKIYGSNDVLIAHLGALGVAIVIVAVGWAKAISRFGGVSITWLPRRPHLLQLCAHLTVFGYWATHHVPVRDQFWLILAQVPFAYLIDMGLSWLRYGTYRFGFGPLPIIGSINLFLWMTDSWFSMQYAMVALAFLSREYFRYRTDHGSRHIFNPSAFALMAVSLALLLTDSTTLARGAEIAVSLGKGPYCFDSILIAGLIVQIVFPVIWTTIGAVLALVVMGTVFTAITGGVYFVDTAIPIAVFLGTMLLITDPATSPASNRGKFVFGVFYGASVFVLYTALELFSALPWGEDVTYFDKLLAVPLLNALSPQIERFAQWVPLGRTMDAWGSYRARAAIIGVWIIAYGALRPQLVANEGREVSFWQYACNQNPSMCDRFAQSWQSRCQGEDVPKSCDTAAPLILERACSEGMKAACIDAALRKLHGRGGYEPDQTGAQRALETICMEGGIEVCAALGKSLWTRKESANGLRRRVLSKACKANEWESCDLLGSLLYDEAQTTEEFRYARDVMRLACSANRPMACSNLGHLMANGRAGGKDLNEAKQVVRKACRLKFEPACRYLEQLKSVNP